MVLGKKYRTIYDFFNNNNDYGKNFLYNILELIRNIDDNRQRKEEDKNINFARYVYILARMEPVDNDEAMIQYREFSEKMYKWIKNKQDRLEVIAAIYIYVYIKRQED